MYRHKVVLLSISCCTLQRYSSTLIFSILVIQWEKSKCQTDLMTLSFSVRCSMPDLMSSTVLLVFSSWLCESSLRVSSASTWVSYSSTRCWPLQRHHGTLIIAVSTLSDWQALWCSRQALVVFAVCYCDFSTVTTDFCEILVGLWTMGNWWS